MLLLVYILNGPVSKFLFFLQINIDLDGAGVCPPVHVFSVETGGSDVGEPDLAHLLPRVCWEKVLHISARSAKMQLTNLTVVCNVDRTQQTMEWSPMMQDRDHPCPLSPRTSQK